jgi:hypothetical protein
MHWKCLSFGHDPFVAITPWGGLRVRPQEFPAVMLAWPVWRRVLGPIWCCCCCCCCCSHGPSDLASTSTSNMFAPVHHRALLRQGIQEVAMPMALSWDSILQSSLSLQHPGSHLSQGPDNFPTWYPELSESSNPSSRNGPKEWQGKRNLAKSVCWNPVGGMGEKCRDEKRPGDSGRRKEGPAVSQSR